MRDIIKDKVRQLMAPHLIQNTIDRSLLEYHGSMNHDRDVVKEMIFNNLKPFIWKSGVKLLTEEQVPEVKYQTSLYLMSELDVEILVAQITTMIKEECNGRF